MFGQELIPVRVVTTVHMLGLARTFQVTTLFSSLTVEENIRLAIQAFSLVAICRSCGQPSAFNEIVDRVESLARGMAFRG